MRSPATAPDLRVVVAAFADDLVAIARRAVLAQAAKTRDAVRARAASRRTTLAPVRARPKPPPLSLLAYEREALLRAIEVVGEDRHDAPALLNMTKSTFYRRLQATGIDPRSPPPRSGFADHLPLDVDAYERAALQRAIEEAGGVWRRAAITLGMGRSSPYRRAEKLGLHQRVGRGPGT